MPAAPLSSGESDMHQHATSAVLDKRHGRLPDMRKRIDATIAGLKSAIEKGQLQRQD